MNRSLLVVIALHATLAITLGWTLNIWSDESCSIATTRGTLAQAFRGAVEFEWQPPGYFVLLWFWRQLNSSIVWARGLSVLCTIGSIRIFYGLSQRLAMPGSSWPFWATLVLALHPYTVFAATELRLYALGLLLTIVQLSWFQQGFLDDQRHYRWGYFGLAVISLYVNILAGLCLAAQHVALWIVGPRKNLRIHGGGLVTVGLVYLPMFLYQLQPLEEKDLSGVDASLAQGLSFIAGSVTFNVAPVPRTEATLYLRMSLTLLLGMVVAAILFHYRRQATPRHWFVWVYLAVVSLLLAMFLVVAELRMNPRYTYPVLAATLLSWGLVVERVPRLWAQSAIWLSTLVFCLTTLGNDYARLCKTGDWIRVSNYLEEQAREGQPIITFISEVDTILRNYYRGPNALIPVPGPQRLDRFVYADFDISTPDIPRRLLAEKLQDADVCWLVTNEGAFRDVDHEYHQQYLHDYLHEQFDVIECREFFDSRVCRLERRLKHKPDNIYDKPAE